MIPNCEFLHKAFWTTGPYILPKNVELKYGVPELYKYKPKGRVIPILVNDDMTYKKLFLI